MFDIKIGTRLIVSLLAVIVFSTAIAVIGYTSIKSLAARGDVMYRRNTMAIEEMWSINTNIEKMRDIYLYIAIPAERNKTAQSINDVMSSVNNEMRIYKDRNIDAEEKKIIADFDAAWPEMQRGYKEIMKLVADNKNYEVERLMDEGSYVVKARKKTFSAIHDLNEFNRKSAAEANKANNVAASTASISLLISTTFVVVVLSF